jgi:hypothetical protein
MISYPAKLSLDGVDHERRLEGEEIVGKSFSGKGCMSAGILNYETDSSAHRH